MQMQSVISRNPNVVSRTLVGEESAVLLDVATTAYFQLNQVASLIWERLEEPSSLAQLVEHVRNVIPTTPANLEAEVQGFVEQMCEGELVTVHDEPETPIAPSEYG